MLSIGERPILDRNGSAVPAPGARGTVFRVKTYLMIIGVSFTAIFAGDIPATYLRIPGTPASAAATLDGHEMAKQGKSGLALMLDLVCSCLGGLIGVGFVVAFLSAYLVIKPFLEFVSTRGFIPFAYYRILLGGIIVAFTIAVGM